MTGSSDLKKDRSQAQEAGANPHAQAVDNVPAAQTNGTAPHPANGLLTNGAPAENSQHLPNTNGASSAMAVASSSAQGPPPLDQSWRDSEQNKSLGKLIVRASQQCYYDLNRTLDEMSAVPIDPPTTQLSNGATPHAVEDTYEASLTKKRLIMDFSNNQRDRFTKLLVLTDWARNAEEKARLIDVKVELDKQRGYFERAENAILEIKRKMRAARVPAPNIEGAMEILATGKASWVPDMNYLRPKPLTSQQLLDTLQDMNVLITERLICHEKLPAYFRKYNVADGRVTFTVENEFEVDLSVAEEDPKSQFYFIDFRLAFTPGEGVDDRIRGFLEGKLNALLATQGLQGCYDFLHDFVLTHKINVLRTQVGELIEGKWFDCIIPETIHRTLVVQYWATLPGPKSWIEFGVASGRDRPVTPFRPADPYISVRCFQRGVLVEGKVPEFDFNTVNLEKCLLQVIADHTNRIIDTLQAQEAALAPEGSPFKANVSPAPGREANDLTLSMPSLRQPLRVRIEDVTGNFSITPPSAGTLNTEKRITTDPTADTSRWLAGLVCAEVLGRARQESEWLQWTPTANLIPQTNLATVFHETSLQFLVFTPKLEWSENSALVFTVSLAGEKWWLVELEDKMNDDGTTAGKIIASARRLETLKDAKGVPLTLSRATLIAVEQQAKEQVALGMLSKQLHDHKIPYTTDKASTTSNMRLCKTKNPEHPKAWFVRFSKLMGDAQNEAKKTWADEIVRITYRDTVRSRHRDNNLKGPSLVQYDMRLSLLPDNMKYLHSFTIDSRERNLAINSSGGLAIRMTSPFGESCIEPARTRLREVVRLNEYAGILKQRHLPCTHFSLSRLGFTYSTSPQLSAELTFPTDGNTTTALKLSPATSNPHQRIRLMLEDCFNNTPDKAFDLLTRVLSITLPVLQAFENLEDKSPASRVLSVHPRTATSYVIRYHAPFQECSFTLQTKIRHECANTSIHWSLEIVRPTTEGDSLPVDFAKALKVLWKGGADNWYGTGAGIMCRAEHVSEVLELVDETVRRFPVEPGAAAPETETAAPAPQQQPSSSSDAKAKGKESAKLEANPNPRPPAASKVKVKQEPDVIMLD